VRAAFKCCGVYDLAVTADVVMTVMSLFVFVMTHLAVMASVLTDVVPPRGHHHRVVLG
jgi:hypothetical protein